MATGTALSKNDTVTDSIADRWQGSKWIQAAPVNPSVAPEPTNSLSAIACPAAKHCTAVGYQDTATYVEITMAEVWNGSKWTVGRAPVSPTEVANSLTGVACSSVSRCIAVGYTESETDNSGYAALAERWTGSKWVLLRMPAP